jgi:7,8-dihydropterin-6-yl-methyl-4-(beta-D-ribofuranosyl)aminobenzene 5'-phosphate synthase
MHNIRALGLSVDNLEKAVLSHSHIDHTGGLAALLSARTKKTLTVIAHPDVLEVKKANIKGSQVPIGLPKLPRDLSVMKLELTRNPVEVLPKLYTTGEIPLGERQEKQGNSPRILHLVNGQYEWDPVIDDLSLVLHTKNGVVIITGCCHAGLLNTCAKVKKLFNKKIEAIIGGVHMVEYTEKEVEHVANALKNDHGTPMLYLNHCTGDKVVEQLRKLLGADVVRDYPGGMELDFEN